MNNRNNKRGFTLVELLIVIVLVAALSVTIGLSTNGMMKKGKTAEYKENVRQVMEAARVYSEINDHLSSGQSNTYTLKQLIESGILDKEILNKLDASNASCINFQETNTVNVTIDSNGLLDVMYNSLRYNNFDNWNESNFVECK